MSDEMKVTDDMMAAIREGIIMGTGILYAKPDGSIVHVPYEDLVKVVGHAHELLGQKKKEPES